jgi:hypothetical protein
MEIEHKLLLPFFFVLLVIFSQLLDPANMFIVKILFYGFIVFREEELERVCLRIEHTDEVL